MACIHTLTVNGETLTFQTDAELLTYINDNPQLLTKIEVQPDVVSSKEIEAKKADIERRRQEELGKTDSYEYDKKFKEFQTYGDTVKEAFDSLFEQVKNNPTNKELSNLLDYITERLVAEDIQKDSGKNPLVQEYINENQQNIVKASKSTESRISKINAKYDAELSTLETNTTEETSELDTAIDEVVNEIVAEQEVIPDGGFTPEITQEIVESIDTIEGLTVPEQFTVIDFAYNQFSSLVKKEYNTNQAVEEVSKRIEETINKKRKELVAELKTLKTNPEANAKRITTVESQLEKIDVIKDNIIELTNLGKKRFLKYTQAVEIFAETESENQQDKSYDASSIEEKGKKTGSYPLKRFFSGIKKVDKDGKPVLGFLGFTIYEGFDTVDDTVKSLLTSPVTIAPDFDTMIMKLEESVPARPFLRELIDKLKSGSDKMKNAFVAENHRYSMTSEFVMWEKNFKTNTYSTKIYKTNSNELNFVLRKQWLNQSLSMENSIYRYDVKDGIYYLKADVVKALYEKYKNIGPTATVQEIQALFEEFGINVTNNSVNQIKSYKYYTTDFFSPKKSLTGYLLNFLNENKDIEADVKLEEDFKNHIFTDASTHLKKMATLEAKHAKLTEVTSFRDGKKSVYAKPLGSNATDTENWLKTDEAHLRNLLNKPFNGKSTLLQLLDTNPEFKDKFKLFFDAISSLKKSSERYNDTDSEVTKLSPIDKKLSRLGMFMDTKQDKLTANIGGRTNTRMTTYMFPTMSDKGQMLLMESYAVNIRKMDISPEGVSDTILNLMYDNMVSGELERIFDFIENHNAKSDIAGYDFGASLFLNFPALNGIDMGNNKVYELFNKTIDESNEEFLTRFRSTVDKQKFMETFKPKAKQVINEWVKQEVLKEVNFYKTNLLDVNGVPVLDAAYLNPLGDTTDERLIVLAYDFIINNALALSDVQAGFSGDPALYATKKMMKYFNKTYFSPKNGVKSFEDAVRNVLDVNIGKRLALLIAPRKKIADTGTYVQIVLEDLQEISSNIPYLVKKLYSVEDGLVAKDYVDKYNKTKSSKERKEILNTLGNLYPDIAEYLDLTTTDAQEYTTLKEHLNTVFKMGYMEKSVYDEILRKHEANEDLTYSELKVVLQPIKPVYTGMINDGINNVARTVYIKTSSFPLIKELTRDKEIDNLRIAMEEFEKQGKTVRASYQSGNKIGSKVEGVKLFNEFGEVASTKQITEQIEKSHLVLDRKNWGVQQDVPAKFEKTEDMSYISMGTQVLKLLFGNGVDNLSNFNYNGKAVSGQDLKDMFNKTFKSLIETQLRKTVESFGYDENYNMTKTVEAFSRIRKTLQDEVEKRDYPKQTLDSLELQGLFTITSKDGSSNKALSGKEYDFIQDIINKKIRKTKANVEKFTKLTGLDIKALGTKSFSMSLVDMSFSLPLWSSPNSDRIEALLNSIIDKKTTAIKLPGYSFVVGSEAGMKLKAVDSKNFKPSQVIYTSAFDGELKGATSGRKAQVFLPLRLRDNNGKLIHFINPDGTPNDTYVSTDENGIFRLRENMISQELLSSITFRIPTSSHVSMADVEIAGILPDICGDIMIVPKNFTKQKGLDFDVDKENMYFLHHYMDGEGVIKPIDKDFINSSKDEINQVIREMKKASELVGGILQLLQSKPVDKDGIVVEGKRPVSSKFYEALGEDEQTEFVSIFGNSVEEDIAQLETRLDELQKASVNKKILENEIVRIHKAVMSHPEVIKMSSTTLSTSVAEAQADAIQALTPVESGLFSYFSTAHQDFKMSLGSAGKIGIGVYSNAVTLNSMLQQLTEKVQLLTRDIEGNIIAKSFKIGSQMSDGTLGSIKSLGRRTNAEALGEKQNTATDNEKLQVLGRVNINNYTINIDVMMTLLGFDLATDEAGNEISIPYFLLSQPIIKDYVKALKDNESITKAYNPKFKEDLVDSLRQKYFSDFVSDYGFLTPEALQSNISNPTNVVQMSALDLFLDLEIYAGVLGKFTSKLNIGSKGLGKSFIGTMEAYNYFAQELPKLEETFSGLTKLVGDWQVAGTQEDLKGFPYIFYNSKEDNYTGINPTTPLGIQTISAIHTSYNMWKPYFLQGTNNIQNLFADVKADITNENTSSTKSIDLDTEIFKEYKKYLITSEAVGMFKGLDLQSERRRLAKDIKNTDGSFENMSIATYLSNLKNNKTYEWLFENRLLNSFSFDEINEATYSLLKYNNTKQEDFDEDTLYQSIPDLISRDTKLPSFNGEEYSTKALARDLIRYTYLQGGIQEAVEFTKYVPVSVLKALGISKDLRGIHNWNQKADNVLSQKLVNNFKEQYFQHNPQRATKITEEAVLGKTGMKNLADVKFIPLSNKELKEGVPMYKSVYYKFQKKGLPKYMLFKKVGNQYVRISLLGDKGMSEYIYNSEVISNIHTSNETITSNTKDSKVPVEEKKTIFGITTSQSGKKVVENIVASPSVNNKTKGLLQAFSESGIIPNLNVSFKTEAEESALIGTNGIYRRAVGNNAPEIILNASIKKQSPDFIARVISSEIAHAVTVPTMNKYFNDNGSFITGVEPTKEMMQLRILFTTAQKHVYQTYGEANWLKFKDGKFDKHEDKMIYGGIYSIYEFVEYMLTKEEFRKNLGGIPIDATNKSFLDRFKELMAKVYASLTGKNIAQGTIDSIFSTLGLSEETTKQITSLLTETVTTTIQAEKQIEDNGVNFEDNIDNTDIYSDRALYSDELARQNIITFNKNPELFRELGLITGYGNVLKTGKDLSYSTYSKNITKLNTSNADKGIPFIVELKKAADNVFIPQIFPTNSSEGLKKLNEKLGKLKVKEVSLEEFNSLSDVEKIKLFKCYG